MRAFASISKSDRRIQAVASLASAASSSPSGGGLSPCGKLIFSSSYANRISSPSVRESRSSYRKQLYIFNPPRTRVTSNSLVAYYKRARLVRGRRLKLDGYAARGQTSAWAYCV